MVYHCTVCVWRLRHGLLLSALSVLGFDPWYVFAHTVIDCLLSTIGYSIFVVTGIFPSCEADELLTLIPIEHPLSKGTSSHTPSIKPSSSQHHDEEDDSEDLSLAMAISASMAGTIIIIIII